MTTFKLLFATMLAIFLTIPTFATHKISLRQAKSLASKASKGSDFPIEVNDEVLKYLNRFLGTEGGRRHMRTCLKRMRKYKGIIGGKLKKEKMPMELMAIPIVESGYENKHSKNQWGSGLWMFIKSTAKSVGLRVDKKVDQRLNVRLSTDAAIKYLKANHKRFNDWQLTLIAYNVGEFKVMKSMKQKGTDDAWKIDNGYLAKVMAVIIIMRNPDAL